MIIIPEKTNFVYEGLELEMEVLSSVRPPSVIHFFLLWSNCVGVMSWYVEHLGYLLNYMFNNLSKIP